VLVQLRSRVADVARRAGKPVHEQDVKVLLTGDADVYKPDGQPLCLLRRGAISPEVCEGAHGALVALRAFASGNRSTYGGGTARQRTKKDGSLSRSTSMHDPVTGVQLPPVLSSIVGFFDRQGGRFPFCRENAFVGKEPEKWKTLLPMVDRVAELFAQEMPTRYGKQQALAEKTHPAFRIGKTPFTTLTVNNNVAGAIHQDKGDYKDGFGIISCVRRGIYQGGWLVFPEYEVAADLQDGDVIFFNSHDWHGVTPFHDTQAGYERISIVYYFRTKMTECGSPAEEIARARKRYGALG
jgi:Oxygenase domain of the 2OGFeDO superfamily